MSNSRGAFESIDAFLKKSSPWSYLVLGLIGFGILMSILLSSNQPVVTDGDPKEGKADESIAPTPTPEDDIYRPLNGQSLTTRMKEKGQGLFIIKNNGDKDAIVKLVDYKTGFTYRHSYVHAKRDLELKEIKEGVYEIKFATGDNYSKSKKVFTSNLRLLKTGQLSTFEIKEIKGKFYSTELLTTLFPAQGGNIELIQISLEEFEDKPEPDDEK
jgi:5-hydroxyisourate hydrolase-like protein (transthyretin family)